MMIYSCKCCNKQKIGFSCDCDLEGNIWDKEGKRSKKEMLKYNKKKEMEKVDKERREGTITNYNYSCKECSKKFKTYENYGYMGGSEKCQ